MAVDKLVDSTKLNNSLEYTADRIRLKTGGSANIPFDFEGETGFGAAIDAIPVGSTHTATITGDGDINACYVTYSGGRYYNEGSFTFHSGETLTAYALGNNIRITINDTNVVEDSSLDTVSGSYNYTLPDKDITIDFYSSRVTSFITITEASLEYETGTYTPTEDISRLTISFANTHTTRPYFVMMIDISSATAVPSSNSMLTWSIESWQDVYDTGLYFYSTDLYYARISYIYQSGSSFSTNETNISGLTGTGNASFGYYLTASEFLPYSGSSNRFFRSGRTYKWIAVWAPTT